MEKSDVHKERLAAQLREFFEEWPRKFVQPALRPDIEINVGELSQFFEEFKRAFPAVLEMRRTGVSSNVWRAAGLKRDEVRNSAVLAWLFDRHADHGQGQTIFQHFLQSLHTNKLILDWEFPSNIQVEENYWTRTESCPLGEQESRVDIEIDSRKFLLFIELKIDAQETNMQLDRYLEIGPRKAQGRPWGILYLTRDGRAPARFVNGHIKIVPIKWKWVASILDAYVKESHTKVQSSFASHFIRQFADHVRQF